MSNINLFAISFSGHTSVSANDGKWHHICYAWENTAGSWKLYKDGKVAASGKGLKTGKTFYSRLLLQYFITLWWFLLWKKPWTFQHPDWVSLHTTAQSKTVNGINTLFDEVLWFSLSLFDRKVTMKRMGIKVTINCFACCFKLSAPKEM